MRTPRIIIVGLLTANLVAACASTQIGTAATTAPTSSITDTTAPDTTTPAPSSTAASTAPASTTVGAATCPGASGIPAGADVGTTIHGDIDGDLTADSITEYSVGGVPHVHSTLATGGQSDAVVQIGFADHVSISFEDFDYSPGSDSKPPVAVLAVGATKAGTAQYTFLTNNIHYCIQPWHTSNGQMWIGRLSADGPYEGLSCDTAAGRRYYAINSAAQAAPGSWTITQTVFHHNFTKIVFDAPLPAQNVPDDATVQHLYGDFSNCDHAPLFP